jgi:DNA-binding PadR family transcriptional regulator
MMSKSTKKLTELEGAALGIIWLNSPCTPYQVRKVFERSPSPHWTGSAGAIYPMIRKLELACLIISQRHKVGRRIGRRYSMTPAGSRALQKWLQRAITEKTIGVPLDALRTRIRFFAALPPSARGKLIGKVQEQLAKHIKTVRAECRRRRVSGDIFSYLAMRGALLALQARQVWLREVRRTAGKRNTSVTLQR